MRRARVSVGRTNAASTGILLAHNGVSIGVLGNTMAPAGRGRGWAEDTLAARPAVNPPVLNKVASPTKRSKRRPTGADASNATVTASIESKEDDTYSEDVQRGLAHRQVQEQKLSAVFGPVTSELAPSKGFTVVAPPPCALGVLQYIRRVNEARKRFLERAGTRFANARGLLKAAEINSSGT